MFFGLAVVSKKIFLPKTNEWNGVNLSMYIKVLETALTVPVVFAAQASDTGLSYTPEKSTRLSVRS